MKKMDFIKAFTIGVCATGLKGYYTSNIKKAIYYSLPDLHFGTMLTTAIGVALLGLATYMLVKDDSKKKEKTRGKERDRKETADKRYKKVVDL